MPCPICGDICECASGAGSDAELLPAKLEIQDTGEPSLPSPAEAASSAGDDQSVPEDSAAWRREVAARLNRYQSRRKPRPPRYPSLRLRFEEGEATRGRPESPGFPQTTVSNQALALDEFCESVPVSGPPNAPETRSALDTKAISYAEEVPVHAATAPVQARATAPVTAKIIEFPRSWTPPLPALDELAEPVFDHPRILEVPEAVPAPPALGGITIEPEPQPDLEKRPGIDIPLQSAPLERRLLSALIDDLIIAAACAIFAFIFWKLTAIRPPRLQIVGVLTGLGFVLWAVYQYLLVVYAGTTPGLRLAGLELLRFDERRVSRRLRRWRVLASFLSAVSLGMGYVWVFLDEDSLCWHDRITHTYFAPKRREPVSNK
jgi:uncharacterized RDD family membrane protein YckC